MRIALVVILLGFPVLEFAVLARLAETHGWWVLAWCLLAALAGFALIKEARFTLVARLGSAFAEGRFSISALVDSARTVLAGLFLIFPGVVSDCIALTLLLLPRRSVAAEPSRMRVGEPGGSIIDGEFRRSR